MRLRCLGPLLAALLLSLSLAACAGSEPPKSKEDAEAEAEAEAEDRANNDPLEGVNRAVFDFNLAADRHVIRPIAEAYRDVVPEPIRNSVHGVATNLGTPLVLLSDLLRADGARAGNTFARLWINTVLGLGGLLGDVAALHGFGARDDDLGLALGSYGVPEGPYLILPILGPSNPRDLSGRVAQGFLDPFDVFVDPSWISYVRFGVEGVDLRARNIETLDQLEKTSLDYYATLRSLYRQYRNAEISDGEPPPSPFATQK